MGVSRACWLVSGDPVTHHCGRKSCVTLVWPRCWGPNTPGRGHRPVVAPPCHSYLPPHNPWLGPSPCKRPVTTSTRGGGHMYVCFFVLLFGVLCAVCMSVAGSVIAHLCVISTPVFPSHLARRPLLCFVFQVPFQHLWWSLDVCWSSWNLEVALAGDTGATYTLSR